MQPVSTVVVTHSSQLDTKPEIHPTDVALMLLGFTHKCT